jgi:1-acyl-sn-glycerol-3-phosphate acyltransferase
VALAFALAANAVSFWLLRLRGHVTLFERAQWMRSSARRVMRALGIHSRIYGRPPSHGLVAANHLSYLDIVIISSAMPCFFVSKSEIKIGRDFGWSSQSV